MVSVIPCARIGKSPARSCPQAETAEVKNLEAFVKTLQAAGVNFDAPFREVPAIGLKIAFILDPVGTRIELTEGLTGK